MIARLSLSATGSLFEDRQRGRGGNVPVVASEHLVSMAEHVLPGGFVRQQIFERRRDVGIGCGWCDVARGRAARLSRNGGIQDERRHAIGERLERRQAKPFVFGQEGEGFGLTPLEAMAAGIPVVVLDTEVSREIYGPAAEYVAEPEPGLIGAALERVLGNGEERARLIEAGAAQVARYSWDECARRTLQVLLACAR